MPMERWSGESLDVLGNHGMGPADYGPAARRVGERWPRPGRPPRRPTSRWAAEAGAALTASGGEMLSTGIVPVTRWLTYRRLGLDGVDRPYPRPGTEEPTHLRRYTCWAVADL